MGSDVILWGVGTSRTMRAHWMLLELGVDYRFHAIGPRTGETHSGEFLRLNPRHKIPVLQHGSLVLTESAAIIEYLSATFPSPQIYRPLNPESFADRTSAITVAISPGASCATVFVLLRSS